MNKTAPEGQIFVCAVCGKRSKDKYGDQKIDRGWDVSCVINSVLCYEDKHEDGYYIVVKCDSCKHFYEDGMCGPHIANKQACLDYIAKE